MESNAAPRIVASEQIGDAIFVEFDDGKFALYSASLLYSSLPDAINVSDTKSDREAEGWS